METYEIVSMTCSPSGMPKGKSIPGVINPDLAEMTMMSKGTDPMGLHDSFWWGEAHYYRGVWFSLNGATRRRYRYYEVTHFVDRMMYMNCRRWLATDRPCVKPPSTPHISRPHAMYEHENEVS